MRKAFECQGETVIATLRQQMGSFFPPPTTTRTVSGEKVNFVLLDPSDCRIDGIDVRAEILAIAAFAFIRAGGL